MDMMTLARTAEFFPGSDHPGRPHRPRLTNSEFLQLGLFRVAYLTAVEDEDGISGVVLHGADGMAITSVDAAEGAAELATELGLVLVAVH
jgi:hypothetical protein